MYMRIVELQSVVCVCVVVAFGRLLNADYVTFMHVLIAAQSNSDPDIKVSHLTLLASYVLLTQRCTHL